MELEVLAAVCAVGFAGAFVSTAVAGRFALCVGLVSTPRPDRWQVRPTPLLGGIGLLAGILLALALGVSLEAISVAPTLGVAAGAIVAAAAGLLDDARPLRPWAKLAGQTAAALVVVGAGGLSIAPSAPPLVSGGASVLLLVAVMNAVNLLDNMDGSAASVVMVLALGAMGVSLVGGHGGVAVTAGALAAACLGFILLNLPLPHARVFMGDTGSILLGLLLGSTVILASGEVQGPGASAAYALLALPLLEVAFVVASRRRARRPIFQGGTDHIAHRLVGAGLSERRAVAAMTSIAGAFAATTVVFLAAGLWAGVAVLTITMTGLAAIARPALSRRQMLMARGPRTASAATCPSIEMPGSAP